MKTICPLIILLCACASEESYRRHKIEASQQRAANERARSASHWGFVSQRVLEHAEKDKTLLPIMIRLPDGTVEVAWMKPKAFERAVKAVD